MDETTATPRRQLLERAMADQGCPSAQAYIAGMRADGVSWLGIARKIDRLYGFDATPEWYRQQFGMVAS